MKTLELRTSSLLYLEIEGCDELRSLAVSAPELEELTFQHNRPQVAIHGDFPGVRSLKVDLVTHLYSDGDINDSRIFLLKRCSSSARSLFVYLDVPSVCTSLYPERLHAFVCSFLFFFFCSLSIDEYFSLS